MEKIVQEMLERHKLQHALTLEPTHEVIPMIVLEGGRGCWIVSVENYKELAAHHRTFKTKADAMECIAMLSQFFEFFNDHVMVMQCITGQAKAPEPKWIKED